MRCLKNFSSEKILCEHVPDCKLVNIVKVVLPEPGTNMKFKNFRHKLRVPFVIYLDFECINKKVTDDKDKNTQKYQEHIPCRFGIHVVAMKGMDFEMEPIVYRSEGIDKHDVINKYLKTIIEVKNKLLKTIKRLPISQRCKIFPLWSTKTTEMRIYPSDFTDSQWKFMKSSLNFKERKCKHDQRSIRNTLNYVVKSVC